MARESTLAIVNDAFYFTQNGIALSATNDRALLQAPPDQEVHIWNGRSCTTD